MGGMTPQLWSIVDDWREKGVTISDDEAEWVRQLCIRKMEVAHIEDPEEYLPLLYADEVKWKLVVGRAINLVSMAMMEQEVAYV